MNLNLIEYMIGSTIFIVFPILIYFLYVIDKKNMKEEENDIVFCICLLSSLLLSLMVFKRATYSIHLLLSTIPILLAYLYNKKYVAIVMNIATISFIYSNINIDFATTLILFILYFILYLIYEKRNIPSKIFANLFYVLTLIVLIINNYSIIFRNTKSLIESIVLFIIYYALTLLIQIILKRAKEILNLFISIKEFEHEKQIKLSLFKITHEIKNPIAVIKGYIDMFDPSNEEKSKRYIGIMKLEIERTLNLLTDFMDFAKISIEKKAFEFNTLLDEVKAIIIPFCEAKNVCYEFKSENNVIINGDYNRLKQVILNIIKNSIESIDNDNGLVLVTSFVSDDNLYLVAKDNGCGMDKETLDKITTTPFYTTKEKGTGLGVCLSKEIIEAHKGKLYYTSSLGKYTIVKIVLPIN